MFYIDPTNNNRVIPFLFSMCVSLSTKQYRYSLYRGQYGAVTLVDLTFQQLNTHKQMVTNFGDCFIHSLCYSHILHLKLIVMKIGFILLLLLLSG